VEDHETIRHDESSFFMLIYTWHEESECQDTLHFAVREKTFVWT